MNFDREVAFPEHDTTFSRELAMVSGEDLVNHPAHYKSESGMEAIDVIDAFTDGLMGFEATHTSNVLKYMLRWKKKNGIQDLEKAKWYLERLINKLKEKEGK